MSTPTRTLSKPGAGKSRRADVQASILHALEEMLGEGPFAPISIDQIARRAGITRTAFYFYFPDKREVLMRLTEDVAAALFEQAERWWQGDGDGPVEIAAALPKIVRLYLDHGTLLRAAAEVATYDEEVRAFWRALVERFVERGERRVRDEQAAGRVARDLRARETVWVLSWMIERACYQHPADATPAQDRALIDALTGIYIRSIYGRLEQ